VKRWGRSTVHEKTLGVIRGYKQHAHTGTIEQRRTCSTGSTTTVQPHDQIYPGVHCKMPVDNQQRDWSEDEVIGHNLALNSGAGISDYRRNSIFKLVQGSHPNLTLVIGFN
jgi:hypothetical protein